MRHSRYFCHRLTAIELQVLLVKKTAFIFYIYSTDVKFKQEKYVLYSSTKLSLNLFCILIRRVKKFIWLSRPFFYHVNFFRCIFCNLIEKVNANCGKIRQAHMCVLSHSYFSTNVRLGQVPILSLQFLQRIIVAFKKLLSLMRKTRPG